MSLTHTFTGIAGLAVAVQLTISALPGQDFMEIDRLEYRDGNVVFERTINQPSVISDWSVFVANGETTVCSGLGSDEYSPQEGRTKVMPLSVFVGDRCNLPPGEYTIYAYWNPRDDRKQVHAQTTFEVME